MSGQNDVYPILLSIARNPVTAVGIPLVLGTFSGLPTRKVTKGYWYQSLDKPASQPPAIAFPIVWTLLYGSMGYASHIAATTLDSSLSPSTRDDVHSALQYYFVSLGLNFAWTPLFFVFKKPGLALLDITALTGTVAYITSKLHGPTGGKSSYFLGPYCAWLAYATYLNGNIWWNNRNRILPQTD